MGSPLAPILAHLYMSELEENIINFTGKKPSVFYRYVDDIFMIFHGTQREIDLFVKFMNNIEPTIKFTLEIQKENKLPFLDVMIERNNLELITYVYRKPTDTGLYLRWTSNQPRNYKINLIKCLCTRAKRICLSDDLFKQELEYYKSIFITNGYPINVINKTIRNIELIPFYGECSLALANKIRKIIKILHRAFRGTNGNKRIVYGYSCYDCQGYYIGQTARGAEVRKEEHKNAFNGKGYSKIAEHCLNNKHRNNWNTDILTIESNDLKRNIKESLLTKELRFKCVLIENKTHYFGGDKN
ncbi:unnamed protein product [Rotaria socialis]|uniref:Reverse transcriptase domain-containing protein n=1 Tax=Rotaria socialis TaxID=392032 RepID=A0A821B4T5_9BILA|nr:unnamed protein product [Rotaria socialis]